MGDDLEQRLREALHRLPRGLEAHVLRVVAEAERLAAVHGVDPAQARIAALAHDLLRATDDDAREASELLRIARAQRYPMEPADEMAPILLHGPLAVTLLRDEYGVHDEDVLGAVAWHTTAHAGMTRLQKLLFLADKIEPHKRARAAAVHGVATLAETDLDAALLAYLDYHVAVALETGWPLHPNTVAGRNELLASRRTRPES